MSNELRQKPKMQVLMESFDKKYVEEIFQEGEKMGLWSHDVTQNLEYDFNGYKYVFSRIHLGVLARDLMLRRMEMEQQEANKAGFGRKVV